MKKTITLLALCLFASAFLKAQTFPYGINYQAIARDANGNVLQLTQVPIQFTILKTSTSGTAVWKEQQLLTTNAMGQFNAIIGNGTPVTPFTTGGFKLLDWSMDSMFIKVEVNSNISFTGVFNLIGASKFQAVPYALYSISTNSKAPTIQTFTVGSGTYTTPAGVLYIKVRMAGGGGGGGSFTPGGIGVNGGNTTFGSSLLTANGGAGGGVYTSTSAMGGTVSIATSSTILKVVANSGGMGGPAGNISNGNYPGGAGGSNAFGGAGGSANGYSGGTNGFNGIANTGGGGAGGSTSSNATSSAGGGGGAGGYLEALISSPSPTYSFSVGTGGTGAAAASVTGSGGNGAAGIIIVEEYYK